MTMSHKVNQIETTQRLTVGKHDVLLNYINGKLEQFSYRLQRVDEEKSIHMPYGGICLSERERLTASDTMYRSLMGCSSENSNPWHTVEVSDIAVLMCILELIGGDIREKDLSIG